MPSPFDELQTHPYHATCIVIGGKGVLIRGASGSGKSTLALALLKHAHQNHEFARLVCDDRVRLGVTGGRVLAFPINAIEGLVEVRGLGLISLPHMPACLITHVVELVDNDPSRLPSPEEAHTQLAGVKLPYLRIKPSAHSPMSVDWFLKASIHP
jgi:serine kinase of HPr protein (carbohydrate metabolism regulator)